MRTLLAFAQPRPLAGLIAIWLVTALLAFLAEGGPPNTLRLLGLCAVFLGLNIFATLHNDLADLDLDRINQPKKPLVSGRASIDAARRLAWAGAIAGLLGAAILGPLSLLFSAILLLLAYWHDSGAKRGVWSAAPSLLSAAVIPLWVWGSWGRLADPVRWIGAALLSVLLFFGVYFLTTVWDYDETESLGDAAHRLGHSRTMLLTWCSLWLALAIVAGSIAFIPYQLGVLVPVLAVQAVALLAAMALSRSKKGLQPASAVAGLGSAVLLIGWLAATG